MADNIEKENAVDAASSEIAKSVPSEVTAPTLESSQPTTSSFNGHEILSEQFKNYLRIAQAMLKTLKRPKDIEIFRNLMLKVQCLNDSQQLKVKSNNNLFFSYCLKILKWTSDNQPLDLYERWYDNAATETASSIWSKDNKSYMALKCLQDGTIIIYAAKCKDTSAGWQDRGLNTLAQMSNF